MELIYLIVIIGISILISYFAKEILKELKAIKLLLTPKEIEPAKPTKISLLRPLFKQEADLLKKKMKAEKRNG